MNSRGAAHDFRMQLEGVGVDGDVNDYKELDDELLSPALSPANKRRLLTAYNPEHKGIRNEQ